MKKEIIKYLNTFDQVLAWISIQFIRFYQLSISPDKWILSPFLKGKVCSHEPHCSEYWVRVLKRYWFVQWLPMITDRILACKPSSEKMYDPEHYRVVFFSSAQIGVPFLKGLLNDKRFEVVGVVSQEDKPVGRGLKLTPNIIKTTALDCWIDWGAIYTPTKINPEKSLEWKHFYDWICDKKADYFVVIAYWKIIPQILLDVPNFWCINVHGSLLPKYRWASPLQTVFLNNEEMSWITIMHMDAWMDTGAIINKLAFKIPFEWTVKDLIEKFEEKWPEFLNDTLWDYAKWEVISNPQNKENATYCQKITKQDWEINPYENSIESIYAKYRWYYLWPKIWFTHNEKKVVIEELVLDEVKYNNLKDTPLFDWKSSLNECIKNIALKPEGKKAMDFKSFKNGYLKG